MNGGYEFKLVYDSVRNRLIIGKNNENRVILYSSPTKVSIAGKVITTDGRGLSNARVTLTGSGGNTRTVMTGSFGNYRFDQVISGDTVTLNAKLKQYQFAPKVINVSQEVLNLDLVAEP